jgi:hypothetical protein
MGGDEDTRKRQSEISDNWTQMAQTSTDAIIQTTTRRKLKMSNSKPNTTLSLGKLRLATKTKDKSPDATGTIYIKRDLFFVSTRS